MGFAGRTLDQHAIAHIKLLMSPRNAPVAHPVYAGAGGGELNRYTNEYSLGTETTSAGPATSGLICYVPGECGNALYMGSATESTVVTLTKRVAPGEGANVTSAYAGVRCVAASIELAYLGAPLQRSGFLGSIHSVGTTVNEMLIASNGGTLGVAGVFGSCSTDEKLSDYAHEYMWLPTEVDQTYTDPTYADSTTDNLYGAKGALVIAFKGLPGAVGIRIRVTCVYESIAKYATGKIVQFDMGTPSRNTIVEMLGMAKPAVLGRASTEAGITPPMPGFRR